MKKLLKKLQIYEFTWGLPTAVIGFFIWNFISVELFNDPEVSIEWFSFSIESSLILMLFWAIVNMGGLFFVPKIFEYFNSEEFYEDFKKLPIWLKVLSFPLFCFVLLAALLMIFKVVAVR